MPSLVPKKIKSSAKEGGAGEVLGAEGNAQRGGVPPLSLSFQLAVQFTFKGQLSKMRRKQAPICKRRKTCTCAEVIPIVTLGAGCFRNQELLRGFLLFSQPVHVVLPSALPGEAAQAA